MPTKFHFEVESVGCLEPDAIIQQGIKVLQQKLALVIQDLTEGEGAGGADDGYEPARSPDPMGMNGQPWQDQGYTTPFGNSGSTQNQWTQGSTTPYGATPYGQNGGSAWS